MASFLVAAAVFATAALAAPAQDLVRRAGPTVYMAGDSTMAPGGGGSGTDGEPSTSDFAVMV